MLPVVQLTACHLPHPPSSPCDLDALGLRLGLRLSLGHCHAQHALVQAGSDAVLLDGVRQCKAARELAEVPLTARYLLVERWCSYSSSSSRGEPKASNACTVRTRTSCRDAASYTKQLQFIRLSQPVVRYALCQLFQAHGFQLCSVRYSHLP
jgi:hypothetical protein